jgi:sugar phosphate isomerase/epimerase
VDEISSDFAEQCRVASDLGLTHVEVRSAWDVNILDLKAEQLTAMKETLADHDLQVSSIGSPIGKIFIDEPFPPHLQRMRHAAEVAHFFDAPYIRIFSFFLRPGADPADHREEVIDRMRAMARVAEEADVVLLHENEKDIYGDVPQRVLDIVESVGSPALRLAWDPANYVQVGVTPFTEGYALLRPYTDYVQIKDALRETGDVVPAGEGDGQVRETVRALAADGFDGFFSMEPHLGTYNEYGALSGPANFTRATRAFTAILDSEGIQYR